jgi:hypothetical protein
MISHGNQQAQICKAHVKGLDVEGPLFEIEARMVSDQAFIFEEVPLDDLESIISADDDEQGGVLLDPFYDLLDDPSSQVHKTDTIASHESTDSSPPLLRQNRAERDASSLDLPPALVDSLISSLSTSDYFSSSYDSSDYESSSEGSNGTSPDVVEMSLSEAIQTKSEEHLTWRSALIDAGIIKPPTFTDVLPEKSCAPDLTNSTHDLLEFEHTELPYISESDDECDFTFVDATSEIASDEDDEYADAACELEDHSPYEWIANLERTAARIEATVAKRIEEDYERYRRQAIVSSLLDKTLFWKDQTGKREQNAELGIEEDPHLWDTESQLTEPIASRNTPILSPKSAHHDEEKTSPKAKIPLTHIYDGTFSAGSDQEAEKGLFAFAPIANMSGEYEGFMEGLSAADVQDMGLQFPQHVSGCYDAVPAPWHLFYGAMYAAPKEAVRKKGLEDIQPAPEQRDKYYGIVEAKSNEEAAELGLINPQYPRGCCIDAFYSIPPRVPPVYNSTMSAASTEEAVSIGMYGSRPMPDKCGESYGFVETYSVEEVEGMGLKDIQHAQGCCSLTQFSIPERIQYLYYGYMFGPSEEAVIQKGLKDPLLLPGFSDKYSGVLSAFSADEARQMGMFEPLRVMWDSDVALMPDFEE